MSAGEDETMAQDIDGGGSGEEEVDDEDGETTEEESGSEDDEEESEEEDGEDGEEGEEDVEGEEEEEEEESDADEAEEDEDEEEEDEEEEGEEEGDEEAAVEEESESGGEDCDVCPICLNRLRRQDIGTPEACDHSFCLECIQEWSKNVNTCPVDRQVFHLILARHAGEEKIFKQIPVEDRSQAEEEEPEEDDPTYCEVCGQADREDRLLLCDGCDLGYHCDCLDPPLANVPVDEWFCPLCQEVRNQAEMTMPRHLRRQIARTRVSERVRRIIADARIERAQRQQRVAAAMEDIGDVEDDDQPGPSTSSSLTTTTATPRRQTTTRKTTRKKTTRKKRRKTTRKRKTTKKKATGTKTTTKRKRKTTRKGKGRKKRKGKKTKRKSSTSGTSPAAVRTARIPPITSVKGRIADRLGLSRPPAGRSIPLQKAPTSTSRVEPGGAGRFSDFKTSSFSILGRRDELYSFAEHEGEERQPVNRPAIPAKALLSRSALSSHKPLSLAPAKRKVPIPEPPAAAIASLSASATASSSSTSSSAAAAATPSFDLLGSIMQKQDLLAKGSRHVIIKRDGSLLAATSGSGAKSSNMGSSSRQSHTASTSSSSSSSSTPVTQSPVKKTESSSEKTSRHGKTDSSDSSLRKGKKYSSHTEKSASSVSWAAEESFKEAADSDDELAAMALATSEDIVTKGKEKASAKGEEDEGGDSVSSKVKAEQNSSLSANKDSDDSGEVEETGPPLLESDGGVVNSQDSENDASSQGNMQSTDTDTNGVVNGGHVGNRLHSVENATNNLSSSHDFSAAVSNFSASESLSSAEVTGLASRMKRNLDYLVSSRGNLAGFESGEEEDMGSIGAGNIDFPFDDREEGEASDSDEEVEVRSPVLVDEEGDQEEGEIVDDEDEWPAPVVRSCGDDDASNGGLDVNAIHVEEMERGMFRKRSESQGEENRGGGDASEAGRKGNVAEEKPDGSLDVKVEVKEEESEDSSEEEEGVNERVKGSFMMGNFLHDLVSNEFDRRKEKALKKEEERKKKEEERERIKQELEEAQEDKSKKKISILDFIGPAGAKFGVVGESNSVPHRGRGRGMGRGAYHRGRNDGNRRENLDYKNGNFQIGRGGGESSFRGSGRGRWPPGPGEQGDGFVNSWKRKGPGEDEEDSESEYSGRRDSRWRRDDEWNDESSQYMEKRDRKFRKFQHDGEKHDKRSDSQDSRAVSQRSGSYDSSSSRSRRRDSEMEYRRKGKWSKRRKSRSRSQDRKRSRRHERRESGDSRRRRGKWSRSRRREEEESSSSSGEDGSGNEDGSMSENGEEETEVAENNRHGGQTNGYEHDQRSHDGQDIKVELRESKDSPDSPQPPAGNSAHGETQEPPPRHPAPHPYPVPPEHLGPRPGPPYPVSSHASHPQDPQGPPPPPPLHSYPGHVRPSAPTVPHPHPHPHPRPPHGQVYPPPHPAPPHPSSTHPSQHPQPHPGVRSTHPGGAHPPYPSPASYPPSRYPGPPHPLTTAPRPGGYPYAGYPTYPPAPRPTNPPHHPGQVAAIPHGRHPNPHLNPHPNPQHPTSAGHAAPYPPQYPPHPGTAASQVAPSTTTPHPHPHAPPHPHPHAPPHPAYYPRPAASHYPPTAPAHAGHPPYPDTSAPSVGAGYPPHNPSAHPPHTQHPAAHPPHPQHPAAHPPHPQHPASHPQHPTAHPPHPQHPHLQAPHPHPHHPGAHPHPQTTAVTVAHPSYSRYPQPVTTSGSANVGMMVKSEPGQEVKHEMTTKAGGLSSSSRHETSNVDRRTSPQRDKKSRRASYRISPPPAIRGVATSDRLASNILHDEVKKGFKQLVEDAVRCALKPAWGSKKVNKDEYKAIFKKSVEKVTASKETVVHQEKIQSLVDAYIMKARKARNS